MRDGPRKHLTFGCTIDTALIGTGVVSMVNLYARVGTITDSVARTQTQPDRSVSLSCDK